MEINNTKIRLVGNEAKHAFKIGFEMKVVAQRFMAKSSVRPKR